MAVDEKLMREVTPDKIDAPRVFGDFKLTIDEYWDADGDPALEVWVILPEDLDPDSYSGRDVGELKFAIRKKIREYDTERFAYIHTAKQSELDEIAHED